MSDTDPLMNVQEAAKYIGKSAGYLANLRKTKPSVLPFIETRATKQNGKNKFLYKKSDLDSFMENDKSDLQKVDFSKIENIKFLLTDFEFSLLELVIRQKKTINESKIILAADMSDSALQRRVYYALSKLAIHLLQ